MKSAVLTIIILFTSFLIGMSQEKNATRVIAHRGAWKNTGAPENSIAALQHAINLNCYGSESDVHLSADSVPFVLHDHSIQGIHIEKTNATDLKKIKLANGESLPTLEEYLLAGKGQNKTRLILEVKSSSISKERSLTLTKKCVELVTQTGVTAITDYIAFDFDVCLQVKKLNPKAHVQYLSGDKNPEDLSAAGLDGFDYHFSVLNRNQNWLAEAHKLKLSTNAWTVNDEENMRWLMDQKIDMITTNEPEKLLKLVK